MPLNYSKWDALELSDDSDIEGHPNVDHRSLVRWKQRDIHEKREQRKQRIAELKAIISLNEVIIPRAKEILKDVEDGGAPKYSAIVERLQTQPTDARPPNSPQSYDQIILSMLIKIKEDLKDEGVTSPDTDQLVQRIKSHLQQMDRTDKDAKSALEDEEKEQKKKITSADIHDGFSKTSLTHEAPPPTATKAKGKEHAPAVTSNASSATTDIEVLNPKDNAEPLSIEDMDDDERIPELSPLLLEFSKIPLGKFEKSYGFIQAHPREVMNPATYDQLVIAGFRAAIKGEDLYAKQCVHQALIVQYCEKLGKDGVSLFFKRMSSGDKRAQMVFVDDLEKTYSMMMSRALKAKKDEESGQERIQLVAEDPSQTISFNVPDGPPPENIKLEGPGSEGLDLEEVKTALQRRWDIFNNFDEELRKALASNKLEEVNDVLGDMDVEKAEDVVKLLEIAGILSFSQSGIVDQTGRGPTETEAAVEEVTEADADKVD